MLRLNTLSESQRKMTPLYDNGLSSTMLFFCQRNSSHNLKCKDSTIHGHSCFFNLLCFSLVRRLKVITKQLLMETVFPSFISFLTPHPLPSLILVIFASLLPAELTKLNPLQHLLIFVILTTFFDRSCSLCSYWSL